MIEPIEAIMGIIGVIAGCLHTLWFTAILEYDYDIGLMMDWDWDRVFYDKKRRERLENS